MKTVKFLSTTIFATALIFSCSSDDDSTPEPVLEEEVITTMTITLTADGQGDVILQTQDLDGDGPNEPEITVSGDLASGTVYNGSILLENETESPAENITLEVEEEDDEHQFFYTVGSGLDATVDYENFDADGNPLGTAFRLTTGSSAGSGSLTFTLRHEPKKPNNGTLSDAGGETDISASFNLTIAE